MNALGRHQRKTPRGPTDDLTEDSLRSRGSHPDEQTREKSRTSSYDIDLDDKILDASHALLAINIGGGVEEAREES